MGLDKIRINLTSEDVEEDEIVEIDGEIEESVQVSKSGGKYTKYRIPVRTKDGKKANLWAFESEVGKIVKARGTDLDEYLKAKLVLGIEPLLDENGDTIKTKSGIDVKNITIRRVE